MIEQAEAAGLITPGVSTVIEATAGNTGVGLTIAATIKGYRCIFVLPDKMSAERIRLLRENVAEAGFREPTRRDSRYPPVKTSDFSAAQPSQLVTE